MTTPLYNTGGQNISGQFGLPLFGIAGWLPFTGNYFWVDETNGSDGNTGGPQDPLKTLSQAHSKCIAGNNDVVFFSGSIHLTSTLNWSKNNTHLVGLCNQTLRGKQALISPTGANAFAPLVNVTAQGCWFKNFAAFYGFNSASNNTICWLEAGGNNSYDCVEFLGFGDGTPSTGTANIAAARALTISGNVGQNTFRDCVFGVDTVSRNAANATLEITGGSPRNSFVGCHFEMLAGAGTPVHLLIGASGISQYVRFDRCTFENGVKSGGTAIAQVANLNAAIGGMVIMKDSVWIGATAWESTTTSQTYFNQPTYTATTPGLAVTNE